MNILRPIPDLTDTTHATPVAVIPLPARLLDFSLAAAALERVYGPLRLGPVEDCPAAGRARILYLAASQAGGES